MDLLQAALGHQQSGRLDLAEEAYRRHLGSLPRDARALFGFAGLCLQQGRLPDAIALYRRLLMQKPKHGDAWLNLGAALKAQGDLPGALDCFERSVRLQPMDPTANFNLGVALAGQGRIRDALAAFDRAIALRPEYAQAHCNRAGALGSLDRFEEALASCERALALKPAYAEAHSNRGTALHRLGRLAEAADAFRAALAIEADARHANHLGSVLSDLGRTEEALAAFDRSIDLNPDYVAANCNRAAALVALGLLDEAIRSCDRALALDPEHVDGYGNKGSALVNKGVALHRLGRLAEATEVLQSARSVDPRNANAHYALGVNLLRVGDFENGWSGYEFRWRTPRSRGYRHGDIEPWTGHTQIIGRRVLVWWEQGLGDTIQFSRFVPLLVDRGAEVVFEIQEPLRALFETLDCGAQIVSDLPPGIRFDYQIPLMSLPWALRLGAEAIARPDPYLSAKEEHVDRWRAVPARGNRRMKIGIACSGNPSHDNDRQRSIPLVRFDPILEFGDAYLIQKEIGEQDERALATRAIADLRTHLTDFAQTAAIVSNLDLVIAVDTSVVHLAGALGKATWVLLSHDCDWRWIEGRTDSPWYPSVRVFRQTSRGDWHGVIERIAFDLAELCRIPAAAHR